VPTQRFWGMSERAVFQAMGASQERPIAVAVVAGDDVMQRRVLDALTIDGVLVSAQAASSEELESDPGDGASDAVVISCRGSADERVAAISAAKVRFPEARIVIIATADSTGVHKAFEAGADGFVFDSEVELTVGPTVRAVCVGQVVVPPMMRSSVVRPALTHREKQTLGLLVLGLTNREIAQRLFLAESTVKCHLTSIFSKLAVRSRSEAARLVLDSPSRLGLAIPQSPRESE
jgi:DNA-binding NarL/FixJ family response regulator